MATIETVVGHDRPAVGDRGNDLSDRGSGGGAPGAPVDAASLAALVGLASSRVDTSLHDASRRVCRAMLLLAPLRESPDPQIRAAYENIHDVMGDLATIHHWTVIATRLRRAG